MREPLEVAVIAKAVMNSVMAGVRIMETIGPEWRWTGLGNFLGSYGELIAIHAYGLTKEANGTAGHDAMTLDGQTVAVKAIHASSQVGFRGTADLMLVLRVREDGACEQVYWGPFGQVLEASGFSARDNKRVIPLTRLRQLALTIPQLPAARGIE